MPKGWLDFLSEMMGKGNGKEKVNIHRSGLAIDLCVTRCFGKDILSKEKTGTD